MKLKNKLLIIIFMITMVLTLLSIKTLAAGFSVTSSRSIKEGETTTITITASECGGRFNISSSNPSVASVSSSSEWIEDGSKSITITGKGTGSATITVTAANVAASDASGNITGSKSCSITVSAKSNGSNTSGTTKKPTTNTQKQEEKKSNDSSLKELIISDLTLNEEFKSDLKQYSLKVPNEITELNITATANDKKATVEIDGNKELKVGENIIKIIVKAEDGTTSTYLITVNREREKLSLKTLIIKYEDENGEEKELLLNPEFNSEILEYNLNNISYLINNLKVEAIPNLEGAIVEIAGNENLTTGENKIVIKITLKAPETVEGEEQKDDEIIEYTIVFNKEPEPTLFQKIKNWFGGMAGTIKKFYNNNQTKIQLGSLAFCTIAMLGLSVYIVIDYNKYKELLEKLKQVNSRTSAYEENKPNDSKNIIEDISMNKKTKTTGRRFK